MTEGCPQAELGGTVAEDVGFGRTGAYREVIKASAELELINNKE